MIVDSAYPLQSSAGVETLETNTDQMEVIRNYSRLSIARFSVRLIVYMDAESSFREKKCSGVTVIRRNRKTALAGIRQR